jgi:hypothetical protein
MTPHKSLTRSLAAAGLSIGTTLSVCGLSMILAATPAMVACEKKKEAPPPPPPPPPPPRSPDPIDIKVVLQSAKPDARVNFGQSYAPTDETLARAVIAFADALARGDSAKFGSMLAPEAKSDLDTLSGSGGWEEGTAKIEAVRVVRLDDMTAGGPGGGPGGSGASTGAMVQFAVQDPTGAYLLGWEAIKVGDKWAFKGADAPNNERRLAAELDGNSAPASSGAAPAASSAPAAAAASDPVTQGAIAAYILVECNRRIATAAGIAVDTAGISKAAAGFGLNAAQLEGLADTGKASLKSGTQLKDEFFTPIFTALKAQAEATGGKVTEDQVIQFISAVSGNGERTVRIKLGLVKAPGGAPKPGGG